MNWRELVRKSNDKARLRACFRAAGLTKQRGKTEVLPTIHSVRYFDDEKRTEFVFTLPNGVDPKLVDKHMFVFKHWFGRSTEVRGDLKRFIVNVYQKKSHKVVPYDYKRFAAHVAAVNHNLPIICGESTTTGRPVTFDMMTHPHILNGGQTGGGKSTWLRAVLTFLIQRFKPTDLRLYLGDLKAVEFILFRDVEHVEALETEIDGIVGMLDMLNTELDRRQALMLKFGATHIDKLPKQSRQPYIIAVIDEFQDLRGNDEAMRLLARIAAKGRALGVFLILTTQRPSAAIVDGDIKANLTISMAFKTKNRINSNMILDAGAPNAANLRGRGHAIVAIDDYIEVQTPYLSEADARKILEPFKNAIERRKPKQNTTDPLGLLGSENDA